MFSSSPWTANPRLPGSEGSAVAITTIKAVLAALRWVLSRSVNAADRWIETCRPPSVVHAATPACG